MRHRPRREMFRKAALIVSTTAGGGTEYAMDSVARPLSHWGISRIFRCGITMRSSDFDGMDPKKARRARRALENAADRLYQSLEHGVAPSMKTRKRFFIMKQVVLRFTDSPSDRSYWRGQGWSLGSKPWDRTAKRTG